MLAGREEVVRAREGDLSAKEDKFKERGEFCNDIGGQESGMKEDGKSCLPPLDVPDRRKLAASELDRFYEEGIPLEGPEQCEELKPMEKRDVISREKELEKNAKSDMWVDKELFLQNFPWAQMREEIDGDVGEEEGERFI